MHLVTAVTDADLLWRYLREGDESAFSSLVRMHERMVIATAWRLTGDADLARDVAQQVFATVACCGGAFCSFLPIPGADSLSRASSRLRASSSASRFSSASSFLVFFLGGGGGGSSGGGASTLATLVAF